MTNILLFVGNNVTFQEPDMELLEGSSGYGDDMSSNMSFVNNSDTGVFNQTQDLYITRQSLKIMMFVFTILLIPVFCLLGSIGNILSLCVLCNRRMPRNQTYYILRALCVSDTIFLIHSLIYTALNVYRKIDPIEGEALRSYVYPFVGAYGSIVSARITSYLTVLLCAERFIAVFFPMQARHILTIRSTCVAIIVICVGTCLVFIPFILKYESITFQLNENITRTVMNKTDFYRNNIKFYSVYGTVLNIIFRFMPLVIIPILNILMIRAVQRTWKSRQGMSLANNKSSTSLLRLSSRSNRHCSSIDQNHITIMLITVSFVFLICILPGALNSIVTHIKTSYGPFGRERNLYILISTVTFLLETINSSVNFIIYMLMSRRFRLLYKEIFCCGHGQYYRKISLSVKEKFRWSSSRKNSKGTENDQYGRRTVSDIGPLINSVNGSRHDKCSSSDSHEIHSDGCELQHRREVYDNRRPATSKSNGRYFKHLHTKSLCDLFLSRNKNRQNGSLPVTTYSSSTSNGIMCRTGGCVANGNTTNTTDL